MIARDTGRTVKVGLDVYDKDGQKVGYVDQVSDAQGWMQVEALGLGLQRLWKTQADAQACWEAQGQTALNLRDRSACWFAQWMRRRSPASVHEIQDRKT